jgi:hypothetical protein
MCAQNAGGALVGGSESLKRTLREGFNLRLDICFRDRDRSKKFVLKPFSLTMATSACELVSGAGQVIE